MRSQFERFFLRSRGGTSSSSSSKHLVGPVRSDKTTFEKDGTAGGERGRAGGKAGGEGGRAGGKEGGVGGRAGGKAGGEDGRAGGKTGGEGGRAEGKAGGARGRADSGATSGATGSERRALATTAVSKGAA